MRVKDKVAVITGAASGIGRATAYLLSEEGANIVVADINDRGGEKTVQVIKDKKRPAIYLHTDVTKSDQVQTMAQSALNEFGRIDCLVNNAAICKGEEVHETDEETWDLDIQVVLKSQYLCSKAVLPYMIEGGGGSIVNISSVNALMGFGASSYSAAKAGVLSLTRTMAVRYGQKGVRVNAICPGTIHTEIWEERVAKDPHVLDRLAKWYPLGRVGKPEDIANAVLFLASDESSFATGAVFVIDGGLTAGMMRMTQELMVSEWD